MWYLNEEREAILRTVREFVATEVAPQAMEIDRSNEFPLALFKRAGELGLLGVNVPAPAMRCGFNQYGAETQRRIVSLTFRIGAINNII